jgi:hypothetical protein
MADDHFAGGAEHGERHELGYQWNHRLCPYQRIPAIFMTGTNNAIGIRSHYGRVPAMGRMGWPRLLTYTNHSPSLCDQVPVRVDDQTKLRDYVAACVVRTFWHR